MDKILTQRIEQGMTRVPNTPDLGKEDLSESMQGIYEEIERTLRVPFVNFIFRTLANFPDYFVPAWQALSPHLRRVECERAGRRLRYLAADEIAVEPLPEDILSSEDRRAVVAFTDAIHYVLPKLLLIVTAFDMQSSGDFVFSPVSTAGDAALIPYGIAEGTGKLPLLDPADAGVRSLFQDIQDQHGHPGVASYYRGLGQYPVFLGHVWQEVRRHVDTDSYRQRKQSMLALAETIAGRELVRRAPAPLPGDAALDAVREILAVFRYRLIPDLLLDATLVQAMLGGPQAAARSRFSVAE